MSRRPVRERFVGEICGVGTTSGTRLVIGRWPTSPFGPVADVMVEHPDGQRLLLAPTPELAEYVGSVYSFDEVVVAHVTADRADGVLRVEAGPLVASVHIGRRDALGWLLRAVPAPLATSPAWITAIDPVARLLLRGVRTRGRSAGGTEHYGASDRHRVVELEASWNGRDLGALAPVSPPVRFGFSSTPERPSIVRVTTTVTRRPCHRSG